MLRKTKRMRSKLPGPVQEKAGHWMVLDHPPKNIEEYKQLLREVKKERDILKGRLKRAKSSRVKEELQQDIQFVENVIMKAEDKIAEYEAEKISEKIKKKAEEMEKMRQKLMRKKPAKKDIYEELEEIRRRLKEKGK